MSSGSTAVPANVGRLYTVARAALGPAFRFLWNFEVEGLDNLPSSGPAVIAPNHISVIDSFVVPAVLPRRITYVGKAEYLDSWKTRHLFPALGMIPIDRAGGAASQAAMDAAAAVLRRGELFGIYPEGTRSRDGLLHKGRTGAARLAFETGAPIVPVGIRGTREIQPPDARAPKIFMTVQIRLGRPLDPTSLAGPDEDPTACRTLTDRLMYEIGRLSGQTYVHRYAGADADVATLAFEDRRTAAEALAATG